MPLGTNRCFELSWDGVGLSCLLIAQLPACKCFGEDLCLGERMGDVQPKPFQGIGGLGFESIQYLNTVKPMLLKRSISGPLDRWARREGPRLASLRVETSLRLVPWKSHGREPTRAWQLDLS